MEENHTNKAHNMSKYDRDVEHTLTQSQSVKNYTRQILVVSDRPYYAKKSYYFLMSLIGCSSVVRNKLMGNSQQAVFKLVKNINAISK